jgi:hypothetical protein
LEELRAMQQLRSSVLFEIHQSGWRKRAARCPSCSQNRGEDGG